MRPEKKELEVIRKVIFKIVLSFFLAAILSIQIAAQKSQPKSSFCQKVPGRLIVKLKEGVRPKKIGVTEPGKLTTEISSLDKLNEKYQIKKINPLFPDEYPPAPGSSLEDLSGFFVLEFSDSINLEEISQAYLNDPAIQTAEPDMICPLDRIPNDPDFYLQWHLKRGDDHDIDAPEAWDIEVGDPFMILAIIDTGILWSHPDLSAAVWTNSKEMVGDANGDGCPGICGVDDDGDGYIDEGEVADDDENGYVDDLRGWDFVTSGMGNCYVNEDCSEEDNDPKDYDGHGTHCAGIAAAVTNNSKGVAGIAGGFSPAEGGCKVMALRVGWTSADGTKGYVGMSYVANAINYARKKGAKVINCSWGSSYLSYLESAVNNAIASDILICKAAGNDDSEETEDYLNNRADVIKVAATDRYDHKASWSNYGTWIDISAPGVDIHSTYSYAYSPTYATLSGTSMSSPVVVGVAGLIRAKKPSLTRQEVTNLLKTYADSIDYLNPGFEGKLGAGRVNANNIISRMPTARFYATNTFGVPPCTVQFSDSSSGEGLYAREWNFGDDSTSTELNPSHIYLNPGTYSPSLTVWGSLGSETTVKESFVGVRADTAELPAKLAYPEEKGIYLPIEVRNFVPANRLVFPLFYGFDTTVVKCDSVRFSGTRAAYFSSITTSISHVNHTVYIELVGSPPLCPGDGVVAKLYFTLKHCAPVGDSIIIDTSYVGGSHFQFSTPWGVFVPAYVAGKIYVGDPPMGDFNRDGQFDLIDVILVANYIFKSGPGANPWYLGDVNGNKAIAVEDCVYLARYVFGTGPAPVPWTL